jgi:multiple sugar transport system substrate-binding protein
VDGIEGIDSTFDRIAFAKPDLDKWLPGYKDFWAWANNPNTEFNFNNLVLAGSTAVPTYAAEWEAKINTLVQAQLEALGS